MKRFILALLLLLLAWPVFAQDMRPVAYQGQQKKITIKGGKILGSSGGVTTIATQDVTPTVNATTYVYIDLSSTPAVATSNSGFPASSYYPICTVITDINGIITSFVDSRPDSFMAGGGGNATNGTGGSVSPASPVMAFYLTNACPVANTGQCFFTSANTQIANDCSWSNGGTTVTCGAHFVAGDVGKRIMGYSVTGAVTGIGCDPDRISFGSMTGGVTAYTIATFISATQVTISTTAAAVGAANSCVIWGTNDDTNATALEAAYSAVTAYCPRVELAASNYWFDIPHFSTQPTGCLAIPTITGAQNGLGNTFLPAGFELEGRGPGATTIYLSNLFPNGDACNHASGGTATTACFAIPVMGKWANFAISGGGQSTCGVANNGTLIVGSVVTMQNITLTNMCFGSSGNTRTGIYASQLSQLYQVNNAGFGEVCLTIDNTGSVSGIRVACENSPKANLIVNGVGGTVVYDFECTNCYFAGSAVAWTIGEQMIQVGANSILRLIGAYISPNPGTSNYASAVNTQLINNTSGTLYLEQSAENVAAANGQAVIGLVDGAAGAVDYLQSSTLNGAGAGSVYNAQTFGTMFDLGGNTFNFANSFKPNVIVSDGHSMAGACTGVATASSTLGLYGTGPNETITTCTSAAVGTGVVMTQGRTLASLQCSSSATTVSVACTVLVNGGASALTCTMTAATSCTDFVHTVAVVKGDLVSERIVTGAAETGANVKASFIWQ